MSTRVCVLTSAHPPLDIRIFHKECRSLAAAGYDVTLIAPAANDQHLDRVNLRAVRKAKNRVERLTRTLWGVYREALREGADIYHFHDPELIPVGLLLRLRGKKVVYDIHEDLPRCMPYKPYLPKWIGRSAARVVEMVENSACRCFSGLVAATPTIAGRFRAINNQTVTVHNYPLMTELAAIPQRPWKWRENLVAYVGSSISIQRAAIEMVRAMGLLPRDFAASLVLAGRFASDDLKQELAAQRGWDRVRLCGVLDRSGVIDLLGRARMGIVLQHPEPNAMAGKPIKMFEYMAAGIPVVSSNFPLWREIVEEAKCGLCVDPLDPIEVCLAIHYLLTHVEEAEQMGRRGRRAIEELYNWDGEKIKLLNLYQQLALPSEERQIATTPGATSGVSGMPGAS